MTIAEQIAKYRSDIIKMLKMDMPNEEIAKALNISISIVTAVEYGRLE